MRTFFLFFLLAGVVSGCTIKAVGDPERPITINANIVVDVRGLKNTAHNIEDLVAEGQPIEQGEVIS